MSRDFDVGPSGARTDDEQQGIVLLDEVRRSPQRNNPANVGAGPSRRCYGHRVYDIGPGRSAVNLVKQDDDVHTKRSRIVPYFRNPNRLNYLKNSPSQKDSKFDDKNKSHRQVILENPDVREIRCERKSHMEIVKFDYVLHKFSLFKDSRGPTYDVVESPEFGTKNDRFKFRLRFILHPRPDRPTDEQSKDHVQVFLHLTHTPKEIVSTKVQLICLRIGKDDTEDTSYQITRSRIYRRNETWGFRRFINRSCMFSETHGFLRDDSVTFRCIIEIEKEQEHLTYESVKPTMNISLNGFKEEEEYLSILDNSVRNMYSSSELTDCTLLTNDGGEEKAHKFILAARSEVLGRMLGSDFKEGKSNKDGMNEIVVSILDKDELSAFVWFLYSGECNDWARYAESLFKAGDYYNIYDLKEQASTQLYSTLEIENAASRYILASQLRDE